MENEVFTVAPAEFGAQGEAMVTWMMEKDGTERDVTIGTLVMFAQGKGQPSTELFTKFPELAKSYYTSLGREVPTAPVIPAT